MSKREKVLLQICICIALVGISTIYLLMPVLKSKKAAIEEQEMMDSEVVQMQAILEAEGIDEELENQKNKARENYDYFYNRLNSYTIDEIFNGIISKSGVQITSLKIGDYKIIDKKVLQRDVANADIINDGEFLLGCDVTFTGVGEYNKILNLISALKAESSCVDVIAANISQDTRNTVFSDAATTSVSLIIYGIEDSEFVSETVE